MKTYIQLLVLVFSLSLITHFSSLTAKTSNSSLDKLPKSTDLGRLCYKKGPSKKIRVDDALWLAKMIHGETGGRPTEEDADAMLWSIAQRTLLPFWRDKSIERLTRAYSQPINEMWTKTGRKCKKFHKTNFKGKVKSNCSLKLVNRRAKFIKMEWSDIAPLARESVLEFSKGRTKNPVIGSVGWFAPNVWKGREKKGINKARKANKKRNIKRRTSMIFHHNIDGNIYFYRGDGPNTRKWKEDEVLVVGPGKTCPSSN